MLFIQRNASLFKRLFNFLNEKILLTIRKRLSPLIKKLVGIARQLKSTQCEDKKKFSY